MAESMSGMKRTHRCAELSKAQVGQTVTVMGWVQKSRNKGGVVLSIGVGYEHEILDGFFVFGEADGQLSFGEDFKFMPSIVVGGRYRF